MLRTLDPVPTYRVNPELDSALGYRVDTGVVKVEPRSVPDCLNLVPVRRARDPPCLVTIPEPKDAPALAWRHSPNAL
jgi:hypothetical protein